METYDVVVIGGGAAGLSGALALARARRRVLVLDGGEPRNGPAQGVHNLLGNEGVPPAQLLARGRAEVERYGASVVPVGVRSARRGVVLFLHTAPEPSHEQLEQLAARGVGVVRGEVVGLEVAGDALVGVRLGDVVVGRRVPADAGGATSVPGVRVAGNVTDPVAQVVTAAAQGVWAGAQLNAELVAEDTALAVAAMRSAA